MINKVIFLSDFIDNKVCNQLPVSFKLSKVNKGENSEWITFDKKIEEIEAYNSTHLVMTKAYKPISKIINPLSTRNNEKT